MIPTSVVFIIRIPSVKTEMACVNFATYKKKKKKTPLEQKWTTQFILTMHEHAFR